MARLDLDFLERLAKGVAEHFGKDCEVVIHDLQSQDLQKTIIAIENGHISNRKVGDGASHIVLESMKQDKKEIQDSVGYLIKTQDGRMLKSSSVYVKDENGDPAYVFCINYDITQLKIGEDALKALTTVNHLDNENLGADSIPTSVNGLLDNLIEQSVKQIGKPVPLMTKEEKVRCIQFLKDSGAFLITKAGDKISKHFGISKYSIYNYIEMKG